MWSRPHRFGLLAQMSQSRSPDLQQNHFRLAMDAQHAATRWVFAPIAQGASMTRPALAHIAGSPCRGIILECLTSPAWAGRQQRAKLQSGIREWTQARVPQACPLDALRAGQMVAQQVRVMLTSPPMTCLFDQLCEDFFNFRLFRFCMQNC